MLDADPGPRPGRIPSSTSSAFRSAAACCSTGWDARAATRRGWSPRRPRCRRRSTSWRRASRSARASTASTRRTSSSTLKPKSLAMARRFPGLLDVAKVQRARTMYDFDDAVTAVLHGFAGAEDYWRRASAKPWLAGVARADAGAERAQRPVRARRSRCPDPADVSADVLLEQPDEGGHVGFLSGPFPGNIDWLPRRLLDFFVHGRSRANVRSRSPAVLPRQRPFDDPSARNLQGLRHSRHRRQDPHAGDRPLHRPRAGFARAGARARHDGRRPRRPPVGSGARRRCRGRNPRVGSAMSSTSAWSRRR